MEESVKLARHDGWAKVTLNRPDRLNAFNEDMHSGLARIFRDLGNDESCRAIVLTGTGRGFCSGQDLTDRRDVGGGGKRDLGSTIERLYNPLIRRLRSMPKPLIVAVNGPAVGAGASLALAGDIVLAARSAMFMQAFSKIGLIPDAGSTWVLPRLIGDARARASMMLSEAISAEKAEAWGMIWRCVEDDSLQAEADALAIKLAKMPTQSLALTKQALNASLSHNLDQQLDMERDLQRMAGYTPDFVEGVTAFLEKRAPNFTGRKA